MNYAIFITRRERSATIGEIRVMCRAFEPRTLVRQHVMRLLIEVKQFLKLF